MCVKLLPGCTLVLGGGAAGEGAGGVNAEAAGWLSERECRVLGWEGRIYMVMQNWGRGAGRGVCHCVLVSSHMYAVHAVCA